MSLVLVLWTFNHVQTRMHRNIRVLRGGGFIH